MSEYIAVDERAEIALDIALRPFVQATQPDQTPQEIAKAMHATLPPFIASDAEMLYHRDRILHGKDADALESVVNVVLNQICQDIPKLEDVCYYSYNDVVNYAVHTMHVDAQKLAETFTIRTATATLETPLTQDQLMGIVYAISAIGTLPSPKIIIDSSLGKVHYKVHYEDLLRHMWQYHTKPALATQELERPYRVRMNQHTVYFDNPEFLQGVLSVCEWLNTDATTVISDLREFTREGEIPLTF